MLSVTRRGLLSQQKSSEIKRHVADLLDATGQGDEAYETIEREILEASVTRNGGNLAAAARALGLTRRQLSLRLEKLRASNR
ncbi:MAG: helix-turn-helix domain-containing protein [Panacagrimonas sp.]